MPVKQYLVIVGGPTASGKTKVAIELARHFRTHILSTDSRQFYREMNIGTAKPTHEELASAPHHFIDSLSIYESYDVGQFESDAMQLLKELFSEHKVVVAVGGSGLFIKALCEGMDDFPEVPEELSQHLRSEYKKQGLSWLQRQVKSCDPSYFQQVDQSNPRRLLRALEVCKATGKPFTDFLRQKPEARPFKVIYILLKWERSQLVERIENRVDQMMENGLLEEAESLYPYRHLPALQTVGYQELFNYLNGSCRLEEAVEKIKTNSRRYAKRQMTWFRKYGDWTAFKPEDVGSVIPFVSTQIAE